MRKSQALSEIVGHFLAKGEFFTDCSQPGDAPLLTGIASLEPAVTQAILLVARRLPLRPEAPCHCLGIVTGSGAPGAKSVWAGAESRLCRSMLDTATSK